MDVRVALRQRIWIGINVGKIGHHVCVVDENGKVCWSGKLANDQRMIEAVIGRARRTGIELRWAIDLTSPLAALLITVLLSAGESVVYVPGRMVATMTGVFRGEGKTDAKDARVIADTARMRDDLQLVTAPDDLVAELTQLSSYRGDLMNDWVRGVNQLRAMLASIFPALEAAFDYSARSPLILVARMCTPAEVRHAGIDGVTNHLTENGAWRKGIDAMAATAVAAAGTQDIAVPGEATTAMLIKRLAAKLLDLDREIKDLDKHITARFREHPQAAIIESCPEWGPTWAPSSASAPVATPWPSSAPLAGWPPTLGSCRCHAIPAGSAAICTGPNVSTGDCGVCSSWPPCPRSRTRDPPGRSISANALSDSFIPRPS